ncbi:site-specific DNA-methyltransferase [Actinocorallia sp. API 0066]|uniref:TRM11 family SAM-dependent methyltransferase n=1 Tax=Actinocorallia sp. API 0066 TaxID=2896846 RepID=UPI001E3AB4C9|nr:DNA methyltransferase [Actinocorallia sp. API 0066]MCD0450422.1 site-specific DNA-methyltransferase [Actinocorallia sp. API 0066]
MTEFVPSVLATGQVVSRVQRRGRYLPESMRHPGKMLPSIARAVIGAYTEPGDLMVDPMCGIGTTLVEAVHLGRDAVGMEYEADFANLSVRNLLHAAAQGASGQPRVVCGGCAEHRRRVLGPARQGRARAHFAAVRGEHARAGQVGDPGW